MSIIIFVLGTGDIQGMFLGSAHLFGLYEHLQLNFYTLWIKFLATHNYRTQRRIIDRVDVYLVVCCGDIRLDLKNNWRRREGGGGGELRKEKRNARTFTFPCKMKLIWVFIFCSIKEWPGVAVIEIFDVEARIARVLEVPFTFFEEGRAAWVFHILGFFSKNKNEQIR